MTEGSRRKRFTAADKRARDREVLAARSAGKTWAQVAAQFDLSQSAARRAAASAARLEAERGLADIDAGHLLQEIVRAEARALYRLEELVHDDNAAVAVGACRALGQLGSDLRDSLTAIGAIKPPQERWVSEQLQIGVSAIAKAADELGIEPDAISRHLASQPVFATRGLVRTNGGTP